MARIPINSDSELIRTLLTEDEIKSLQTQGLYIDTVFRTLWTKLANGEMRRLGGGRKVDISNYPGIGEELTTTLPILPNTKAGQPESPVQVLNHLYARATTHVTPVRNPRILISNAVVDKDAETIQFDLQFVDFRDLTSATAYLTEDDQDGTNIVTLGSVIAGPEGDPDEAVRSVTVPITEFSDTRNRLFVDAVNLSGEGFYSNKLTLDVVAPPILPGAVTINSFNREGGFIYFNITTERLDYTQPIVLFAQGSEGISRIAPLDEFTTDTTDDYTFNFAYQGVGNLDLRIEATDLNDEHVDSNTVVYAFPEADLRIVSQEVDEVAGVYRATVAGEEMLADSRQYVTTLQENSPSDVYEQMFFASGKSVDVEVPIYPSRSKHMAVRFKIDVGEQLPAYLHGNIPLNGGTEVLPTVEFGKFTRNLTTHAVTVNHELTGEALRATLEVSDSESGPFEPLAASYEEMLVTSGRSVEFNVRLDPMNVTRWVRPVIHMRDRSVPGVAKQIKLDSHVTYFPDGDLRVPQGESVVKGYLNSTSFVFEGTQLKLYATALEATPEEDWTLVYEGDVDALDSGIDVTTFSDIDDTLVFVRGELINPEGTYPIRTARLIIVPADHTAPTVTIASVVLNSNTGGRVISGTLTGLDRPDTMNVRAIEPDGDSYYFDNQIPVTWEGNTFTLTANISAAPAADRMNGDFDLELSGASTAGQHSMWTSMWYGRYSNNAYMGITNPEFDLKQGTVAFYCNHDGIDLSGPMVVTQADSEGNVRVLPQCRYDTQFIERNEWLNDETMSGTVTYEFTCTTVDGDTRVSSISTDAVLPHTTDGSVAVIDEVYGRYLTHSFDLYSDVSLLDEVKFEYWRVWSDTNPEGFSVEDSVDLLREPYGVYTFELRIVLPDNTVHTAQETVNYDGGWLNLTSIVDDLTGDLLLVPSIDNSKAESATFEVEEWSEPGDTIKYTIEHPDNYSVESGNLGITVPLTALNGKGVSYLSARLGPWWVHAKFTRPETIRSGRIVAVQQSGRNLNVQWKVRGDIDPSEFTDRSFILKVIDQQSVITEYDVTPSGELELINNTPVTLEETVSGTVMMSLVLRDNSTGSNVDLPSSLFTYTLNDKAYFSIANFAFESNKVIIHFESNLIVVAGAFAPKLTITQMDVNSPTVLVSDITVNMREGIGSYVLDGIDNSVTSLLIAATYESSTGEERQFTQRIARSAVNPKFTDIVYDRDADNASVNVTGLLAANQRSGLFSLQTRQGGTAPWLLEDFESVRETGVISPSGFNLTFPRKDGQTKENESLFSEYRLFTMDDKGPVYSEPYVISNEPAIQLFAFDIGAATEHDPVYYNIDMMFRDVNVDAPALLKDSQGLLVDVTGGLRELSVGSPAVNYLNIWLRDMDIVPPFTVRVISTLGDPLTSTWPIGATAIELPNGISIRDVRYVVAPSGDVLYLRVEVSLIGADASAFMLDVDGTGDVTPDVSVTDLGSSNWELLHVVSSPNLTSLVVKAEDLSNNPYDYTYTVTGDEIIEGTWGEVGEIGFNEPTFERNVYGTYAVITSDLTIDETLAGENPTIEITCDDGRDVTDITFDKKVIETNIYALSLNVGTFDFNTLTLTVTSEDGLYTFATTYTWTGNEVIVGQPIDFTVADINYINNSDGELDKLSLLIKLPGAYRTSTYLFCNGSQVAGSDVTVKLLDNSDLRLTATLPDTYTAPADITKLGVKTRTSSEEGYFTEPDVSLMSTITPIDKPTVGSTTVLSVSDVVVRPDVFGSAEPAILEFVASATENALSTIEPIVVQVNGVATEVVGTPVDTGQDTKTYKFMVKAPTFDVITFSLTFQDSIGRTYYINHLTNGAEEVFTQVSQATLDDVKYVVSTIDSIMQMSARVNVTPLVDNFTKVYLDGSTNPTPIVSVSQADENGFKSVYFDVPDTTSTTSVKVVTVNYEDETTVCDYTLTGNEEIVDLDAVPVPALEIEYVDFWSGIGTDPVALTLYVGISISDIDTDACRFSFDGGPFVPALSAEMYNGVMEAGYTIEPSDFSTFVLEVTPTGGDPMTVEYTLTGDENIDGEPPASMNDFDIAIRNVTSYPDTSHIIDITVSNVTLEAGAKFSYLRKGGTLDEIVELTHTTDGSGEYLMGITANAGEYTQEGWTIMLSGAVEQRASYFTVEPEFPVELGAVEPVVNGNVMVSNTEVLYRGGLYLSITVPRMTDNEEIIDWTSPVMNLSSSPSNYTVSDVVDAGGPMTLLLPIDDYQAGDTITVSNAEGVEAIASVDMTLPSPNGGGDIPIGPGPGEGEGPPQTGEFTVDDLLVSAPDGVRELEFRLSNLPMVPLDPDSPTLHLDGGEAAIQSVAGLEPGEGPDTTIVRFSVGSVEFESLLIRVGDIDGFTYSVTVHLGSGVLVPLGPIVS